MYSCKSSTGRLQSFVQSRQAATRVCDVSRFSRVRTTSAEDRFSLLTNMSNEYKVIDSEYETESESGFSWNSEYESDSESESEWDFDAFEYFFVDTIISGAYNVLVSQIAIRQ